MHLIRPWRDPLQQYVRERAIPHDPAILSGGIALLGPLVSAIGTTDLREAQLAAEMLAIHLRDAVSSQYGYETSDDVSDLADNLAGELARFIRS